MLRQEDQQSIPSLSQIVSSRSKQNRQNWHAYTLDSTECDNTDVLENNALVFCSSFIQKNNFALFLLQIITKFKNVIKVRKI